MTSRLAAKVDTGYSATAPTELQLTLRKQGYRPTSGQPCILTQHTGGVVSAIEPVWNIGISDFNGIYADIADAGYLLVGADEAGRHMGNDAGIARMGEKKTWAQANGGWNKKPILLGMSMGALLSFNYARVSPSSVAGIVVALPVCDLQDLWSNAAFTANVNTAYGGTYNNSTMGATHNPAVFGAQLAGVPILVLADQDDVTTTKWSTVQAFAALVGSSCTVVSGHWGGTHGSAQEFTAIRSHMPEILQFLDTLKVNDS